MVFYRYVLLESELLLLSLQAGQTLKFRKHLCGVKTQKDIDLI